MKRFLNWKGLIAAMVLTFAGASVGFSIVGVPVLVMGQKGTFAVKTTLASAVSAADSAGKTIWTVGYTPVSADLTVPATRYVRAWFGSNIEVASGKTLAFTAGTFEAGGDYQVFSGTGTVSGLRFAFGRWFGATGDGSTDDTTGLNKVVTAARNVKIMDGTYMVNATSGTGVMRGVVVPDNTHITLSPGAIIKMIPNSSPGTSSNPVTCITVWGSKVTIEGGSIIGDRELHTYTGYPGSTHELSFLINVANNTANIKDITIRGIYFKDATGDAIQITGMNSGVYYYPDNVIITENRIEASRRNNISVIVGQNITIDRNTIIDAGITKYGMDGTAPKSGVDIEGGSNPWRVKITNNTFKGNVSAALNVFNGNEVIVSGNISDAGFLYQYASNVLFSDNVLRNLADTTHPGIYQDVTSISPATSGTMLAIGTKYVINARVTLDFTTVGAANNTPGTIFVATGVGPLGSGDSVTKQLENIAIVNNSISGFADGIQTTGLTRKITIKNNTLRSQSNTGINVNTNSIGATGGVDITGNSLWDQAIAIRVSGVGASIMANVIDGTTNRAIYATGTSSGTIKENQIYNHTNAINAAIDISGGVWTVERNTIAAGTVGPPGYAILNNTSGTKIIGNVIDGGTFGSAAVKLSQRANFIDNRLLGVLAPYGVYSNSSNASGSIIDRNYLDMTSTSGSRYGIFFSGGGTGIRITGNGIYNAASVMTNSINTDANTYSIIAGNHITSGPVLADATDTVYANIAPGYLPMVYYAAALPTSGAYIVGDRVVNSAATVGQPKAWAATVAGGLYSTTRADATAVAVGVWALWSTGTTVWECTTAGTTTTGAPSTAGKNVGDTLTDGTVVWTKRSTTVATLVSEGNL